MKHQNEKININNLKIVEWISWDEMELRLSNGELKKELSFWGGWFGIEKIHGIKNSVDPVKSGEYNSYWAFYLDVMINKSLEDEWFNENNETKESLKKRFGILREEIIKNNLRIGGDTHQNKYIPVFNDGTVMTFSFRGWGDLQAAIWSDIDGKMYTYMDFYMQCLIDNEGI